MEGIRELVSLIRQSPADYEKAVEKTIEHLRSHGWIHEDNVVEGKVECTREIECPDALEGMCMQCPDSRPATVKDLIGRE
jgi:hypothetical protein